ncbi:hypothetical protein [Agromyces sp. PvR057]|uniref:hypothetical protein n=1 Tax=Agromyces sp. PvR057 TaxID=3156403 RepID=UPI0033955B25
MRRQRIHAGDLHESLGLAEVHAHERGRERALCDVDEQVRGLGLRSNCAETHSGVQEDLQSAPRSFGLGLGAMEAEREGGPFRDVVHRDLRARVGHEVIDGADDDRSDDARCAVQGGIGRSVPVSASERHAQGQEALERAPDEFDGFAPSPFEDRRVDLHDDPGMIDGDQPARGQQWKRAKSVFRRHGGMHERMISAPRARVNMARAGPRIDPRLAESAPAG